MKKRTFREILFGKRLDYSGLPVMDKTLHAREFVYEIEKAKRFSFKESFNNLKKRLPKRKYPKYKSSLPRGIPKWVKVAMIMTFSAIIAGFIAWLVSLRPDIIVQVRGADAKLYIEEQQGIVTNLSANVIMLLIFIVHIEYVIGNRVFIPQGLLARAR